MADNSAIFYQEINFHQSYSNFIVYIYISHTRTYGKSLVLYKDYASTVHNTI